MANRGYATVLGSALLVALVGFWVALAFVKPAPPDRIVLSTGREDGAYYLFAQRYREILARSRVRLEIRTSAGSVENLDRLRADAGGVDLAFVQGGTKAGAETGDLISLGSLYYEPLWVFTRGDRRVARLGELRGKRIGVDKPGSGTRPVAMRLLADNGVTPSSASLSDLGGQEATAALRHGRLDAAFFIASPRSPVVRELLKGDGLRLMSFQQAEAYIRIYPYLSRLVLPQGVIDLDKNVPAADTMLLAVTANLVARRELHPALVDLLLRAAEEVHGAGGIFERQGEFPAPMHLEFPLSEEAGRYYKRGPSFLPRYLPFWIATFVDRMLVMLIPLVALVWPMSRVLPPLYRWRVQRKIYRWYKDVKAVDPMSSSGPADLDARLRQVGRIESEINKLSVPLAYANRVYELRMHINLVRQRLEAAPQAGGSGGKGTS